MPHENLRNRRPKRLYDIKRRCFATDVSDSTVYAILSHRWDPNELTFKHLRRRSQNYFPFPSTTPYDFVTVDPFFRSRKYQAPLDSKFNHFCRIAFKTYGCRYVWMDSACINQDDGDELDTSIQSMYWWYKNAYVCIVYLADARDAQSLPRSSWFTRGWTLQELLAPTRLAFFYGNWTRVSSSKFDVIRGLGVSQEHQDRELFDLGLNGRILREQVAMAAGIHRNFLYLPFEPDRKHLSSVLSWAKSRTTTEPEDAVYSLISLLRVCVPHCYGEGRERALERLTIACQDPPLSPSLPMFLINRFAALPTIWDLRGAMKKFCKYHQSLRGNVSFIHVLHSHPDRATRSTYVLFTLDPLPSNSMKNFRVLQGVYEP
ncbi:hypothetical protein ONZ45_g16307 [Pleurotus djamor]|nr:hypothetical protein ONZ45_g16307 [Pleurotus djamor]